MRVITIIILTFGLLSAKSQSNKSTSGVTKETKREFKNEGEKEDHWAIQFFDKKHSKQVFRRFTGNIALNGNVIKYGDQTLEVTYTLQELKKVFSSGIFYPQLINGDLKGELKSKEELRKLPPEQRSLYYMTNPAADSLKITDFQELKFLSKTFKQKRFRFWLFHNWLANPIVYYIELTNENATEKTDLTTFINGSKLTLLKQGGVIL